MFLQLIRWMDVNSYTENTVILRDFSPFFKDVPVCQSIEIDCKNVAVKNLHL